MKKIIFFLFISIALFSCSDDDDDNKLIDVSVFFQYPEGVEDVPTKDFLLNFVNSHNAKEFVGVAQEDGSLKFTIESGEYNITATNHIVQSSGNDFIYSGSKMNINIVGENVVSITIDMTLVGKTGFILKELYYTGCRTPENKGYYADGFIEIYNNSDKVLYADGLCFSDVEGFSSKAPSNWITDGSYTVGLPCTMQTWIIPGSGQENPVQPYESIVIAIDGINHKSAENNPNSPVDMSNADFETYIHINDKDTDAPAVANLKILYTTTTLGSEWMMSTNGAAVVIFRIPEGATEYAKKESSYSTKPGSSSTKNYLIINPEWIIDGVDCVKSEEAKNKRIENSIDVGYVFCESSWSGKSIRRKVAEIKDGHAIYQDTNNSSNDFLTDQTPTPGVHPTVVD